MDQYNEEYIQDQSVGSEIQEEEMSESKSFRLAGFWVRVWAYICDLIVISALTFLFVNPLLKLLGMDNQIPDWLQLQVSIFTIGIVGFIYFAAMTKIWSQTLGKMMMGVKVVRIDGKPLDVLTVIFREGIGRAISQLFGLHLGYIWAGFHPRKQSWHDQVGDTYVVYEEEVAQKQFVHIPSEKPVR